MLLHQRDRSQKWKIDPTTEPRSTGHHPLSPSREIESKPKKRQGSRANESAAKTLTGQVQIAKISVKVFVDLILPAFFTSLPLPFFSPTTHSQTYLSPPKELFSKSLRESVECGLAILVSVPIHVFTVAAKTSQKNLKITKKPQFLNNCQAHPKSLQHLPQISINFPKASPRSSISLPHQTIDAVIPTRFKLTIP